MFTIADGYPSDALRQADLFSGSAQRTIVDIDPGGHEVRRKERIIVGEWQVLPDDILEGRPCLSEQTVRTIGGALGLVDPVTAHRLTDEIERLRDRLNEVEAENTRLREINAALPTIMQYPRDAVAIEHIDLAPVAAFEEAIL